MPGFAMAGGALGVVVAIVAEEEGEGTLAGAGVPMTVGSLAIVNGWS